MLILCINRRADSYFSKKKQHMMEQILVSSINESNINGNNNVESKDKSRRRELSEL